MLARPSFSYGIMARASTWRTPIGCSRHFSGSTATRTTRAPVLASQPVVASSSDMVEKSGRRALLVKGLHSSSRFPLEGLRVVCSSGDGYGAATAGGREFGGRLQNPAARAAPWGLEIT